MNRFMPIGRIDVKRSGRVFQCAVFSFSVLWLLSISHTYSDSKLKQALIANLVLEHLNGILGLNAGRLGFDFGCAFEGDPECSRNTRGGNAIGDSIRTVANYSKCCFEHFEQKYFRQKKQRNNLCNLKSLPQPLHDISPPFRAFR